MTPANKTATKTLLSALVHFNRGPIDFYRFLRGSNPHRLLTGLPSVHRYQVESEAKARATLRTLQRSGYVRFYALDDKLMVELTEKAKSIYWVSRLRDGTVQKNGWKTVVIFDIPALHNNIRRRFRLLLRQSDFKKLQQSVWVSERDVKDTVVEFIRQFNLEEWVTVFYGKDFTA